MICVDKNMKFIEKYFNLNIKNIENENRWIKELVILMKVKDKRSVNFWIGIKKGYTMLCLESF